MNLEVDQDGPTVLSVTGTNGKTSTVEFVRQILTYAGVRAASWGTLGLITDERREPDPFIEGGKTGLPWFLDGLRLKQIDVVAIEAYSAALERGLHDDVNPTAAAFTNLGRDHLDVHRSQERYFRAKCRLFDTVLKPGTMAILNADSPEYDTLTEVCKERGIDVLGFGRSVDADLRFFDTVPSRRGTTVSISLHEEHCRIDLPLIGEFMVENALCAAGLCLTIGISVKQIFAALSHLQPPLGRLERVIAYNGAEIYVDYAHTPDALETVLGEMQKRTTRQLFVIFGCGGDRDSEKRLEMGAVAARKADVVYVTDDNPRDEDPEKIRATILEGCPNGIDVPNRATAIETALQDLQPGDVLVVAGKGHEETQTVGGNVKAFSDQKVIVIAATLEGDPRTYSSHHILSSHIYD